VERDLERRSRSRHAREYERRRSAGQFRIPYENDAVDLVSKLADAGCVASRNEQKQRAHLRESRAELFPAGTPKDLFTNRRLRPARHYEDVRSSFDLVADLVERHAVEKAVGDSMGIFVFYQGAEGRKVTNKVSDDYTSVTCFGSRYSECYVRCGNRIAGRDD
jgi:hypothetical protein